MGILEEYINSLAWLGTIQTFVLFIIVGSIALAHQLQKKGTTTAAVHKHKKAEIAHES